MVSLRGLARTRVGEARRTCPATLPLVHPWRGLRLPVSLQ